jgi:hypothetical protein
MMSRISTLYTAPIDHSPQMQGLLKQQQQARRTQIAGSVPPFPFAFGLYMLFDDASDDFELPLAAVMHHTLLHSNCKAYQALLRFYRMTYMDDGSRQLPLELDEIMKYLLRSSVILQLDQPSTWQEEAAGVAMIVSATHVSQCISLSYTPFSLSFTSQSTKASKLISLRYASSIHITCTEKRHVRGHECAGDVARPLPDRDRDRDPLLVRAPLLGRRPLCAPSRLAGGGFSPA